MTAPGLFDPTPGHFGLARPDTGGDGAILMLPFDDRATTARPRDLSANLAPLVALFDVAPVLDPGGWTGRARDFGGLLATGFEALDQAGGLTLAARDVSIEVLLTMRLASGLSYPRCVIQRGRGGSAPERINYRLMVDDLGGGDYEVKLDWQDLAGADASPATGATFRAPPETDVCYLVATRRLEGADWITAYYLNGLPIGGDSVAYAQVGGATTGHTRIGIGYNAPIVSDDYLWDGLLDELRVVDFEISAEEVMATWLRLSRYQGDGDRAFRALSPPGSAWGKPGAETRWGKLARIAGEGLGYTLAKIEELRSNWLPTRAYRDAIALWEDLVAASPRSRDSLAMRRGRVVDLLGRDNGFAVPQVQIALAESFDEVAADVTIVEFSNRVTDTFASLSAARWEIHGAEWTASAGKVQIDTSAGYAGALDLEDSRVTMACASGRGRLVALAEMSTYAGVLPTDLVVGCVVMNAASHDAILFGIRHHGGNDQVGYVKVTAGVAGAFVSVLAAAFSEPIWLRITRGPDGRAADDAASTTWRLSWSVDDAVSGFHDTDITHATLEPTEAGVAAYAAGAVAAGSTVGKFDSFLLDTPMGLRPFEWYAFRDLGDPGDPETARSDALVRRLRPAHTGAAAIFSYEVLCDDELLGLCDHGPCGGL